ncbi:hypothetical protein niasHT_011726 [Heterodera trifolii]|uniref:RNA-directed DNA polymerase n=1 Tax=Heterodera trifolii TaxID=157864 RepID=A0ABD2LI30_9BILA
MADPTIKDLLQFIATQQQQLQQQQTQFAQFVGGQGQTQQNQQANATIPHLPDIGIFEPNEEKSRISEWLDRFECLTAEKWENEDLRQFINRHKQLLNNFKFVDLKEEQFKGLMLLTALKSSRDTVLRQRILSKLASDGENVKYDEVVEDCINFMTTITEAKMIEHSTSKLAVNAVKQNVNKREKGNMPKFQQGHTSTHTPKCWRCGKPYHSYKDCGHKSAKCHKCNQVGHLIKIRKEFFVAKRGSLNLLSVQAMDEFGLLNELKAKIKPAINVCSAGEETRGKAKRTPDLPTKDAETHINGIKQKFAKIFDNKLGRCLKAKAHLSLKPDAQPVFRKARPVPYNAREAVEGELDRWEKMGVIEKIEYTDWAAPILVVKKADGSARLCIDYSTGLNAALQDHQHPLPLPDDIFAALNGGKFFSKIDLRDAYLQVELDEKSKKISDFEFATAYLDDVIIVGKSMEEHSKQLEEVFSRFQEWGFRVKLEKRSFFQDEIKYLRQIIDKNGQRPDPAKISAIMEMPAPTDVSSLRSYLGMINHYQQFVKNMRFIRKPLDDLLKQDSEWRWSEKCKEAFDKIKEILSSNLLLTQYDPGKEIIVAADASEKGIGAVISHRFPDGTIKAIAHASSALTAAEKNYSQIEKEALALIFAVQKFHKMIYGRSFTLLTDHKPLLAIFGGKKGIRQCSANRLLRWSLILLAYDFKIEYVNTKDFRQADALSRLIAKGKSEEERVIANLRMENSEFEQFLINSIESLPISFKDIIKSSDSDRTIENVKKYVKNGWPRNIGNESAEIKLFHRINDQLSITTV